MNEKEFLIHIKGILSWVYEAKLKNPEYVYDNFFEFAELEKNFYELQIEDKITLYVMNFLRFEIIRAEEMRKKPEKEVSKHVVSDDELTKNLRIIIASAVTRDETELENLLKKIDELNLNNTDELLSLFLSGELKKLNEEVNKKDVGKKK